MDYKRKWYTKLLDPDDSRYDVDVRNLKENRDETTLLRITINSVIDRMNQFLPDVPLSEKKYFVETLQKHGHYFKSGESYSMIVKTSTSDSPLKRNVDKMLELHKLAVEELTEAIRYTAEYLGPDKLPAAPGWSWYDALVKYAPDKAKVFAIFDPVKKALPYEVLITDEGSFDPRTRTLMNEGGLLDILVELTDLNDGGRVELMSHIKRYGHAMFVGDKKTPYRHSIQVVDTTRYWLSDVGVLNQASPEQKEIDKDG